tara:strand:+ start:16289 stop:18106 length:1818 start_codon:yes stop_codon:yes gene_type:complete
MCGIVGAVAQRNVEKILVTGLHRLEYRGYDSAGVALLSDEGDLQRARAKGKVSDLEAQIEKSPVHGHTGIAHTRWATHGEPSEANAHPHMSGSFAIVHNGIIENYESLREQLTKAGFTFSSETDTEVIVHLLAHEFKRSNDFMAAVKATIAQLRGAYALGIIYQAEPGRLIAVRQGSPLVIGLGIDENFIASDQLALLPVTQQFIYLDEGDIADMRFDHIDIVDAAGKAVERAIHESNLQHETTTKGKYRHYMLKEIYEQPRSISDTLEGRLSGDHILENLLGTKATDILKKAERLQFVACGTSYHAALVGRYWLESIARMPCRVELASEIRYRNAVVQPNTVFVSLSQSGETADTLAALRDGKDYIGSMTICNVPESSLVRESDFALMTHAGPEIGVASTKAFTTQLTALLLLTGLLAKRLPSFDEKAFVEQLRRLPDMIIQVLKLDGEIKALSKRFADKHHTLFLGRGAQSPIAMEGALKLKEISYIHAEAYAAGELKHGPLALVDEHMPVVAVAPNDQLLEKLKSNLQEVRARGGELIVFADETSQMEASDGVTIINMPHVDSIIAPIVYTLPLQLLAYHVAVLKGTDVDQPRNLAKSVTVE